MIRPALAQLVLTLGVFAVATPLRAQTPGYAARPSGYDLNFNGVVGQGGTGDVNVCDGIGNQTATTGEDVDGNGVNDRQVYVDLTSGNDSASCGLPGSPCRTIAFAMNGGNVNVAGGPIQNPAAAQIQAICFKGIGRETVVPTVSGAPGSYVLPQSGRQVRSFNLPRYPFILSGWDASNNDQYPPYDAADTAVLDGALGGTSLDIAIDNTNCVSNFEVAHFTAKNYGQVNSSLNTGFTRLAPACSGPMTQTYFHDLQLTDIMKATQNQSYHVLFNAFVGAAVNTYLSVVNINVTNVGGGYFTRGAGPQAVVIGPYRFQNISVTAFGYSDTNGTCPGTVGGGVECTWDGIKLWDYLTGVEILDNDFNLNPTAWTPHTGGGAGSFFATADYCVQDWVARGNKVTDFKQFVSVAPWYGNTSQCYSRSVDRVVVDRNVFRNTYAPWFFGDWGIQIEPGSSAVDTTGTITITNNFLSSTAGWESCIWANGGNPSGPQTGVVTIAGNTCDGPINRHAAIVIGNPESSQLAFPQQNYVIKDNIITGTLGGANMMTEFSVTGLVSDGNAYDPLSGFVWNNGSQTLATWRTASGGDQHSKQCTPVFISEATGNFRLGPSDTCAKSAGVSLAQITTWDIDGIARSSTNPSIGASETSSRVPATPTNVHVVR